MKKLLFVLGLVLLLLSLYLYASSYNYGSFVRAWYIICYTPDLISQIKSNPFHIIITWFETGIRFKTLNLCFNYISKSFPYLFLFGWIVIILSIFLHFGEKNQKSKM